jgi:putative Ca2+/H+ antiporter (TMEM165/GDT1 family)
MGIWALIPDKLEDAKVNEAATNIGIFWVTIVTFFLAEMGDKTQIATAALAARYHNVLFVVMGTTIGMLLADVPAVFIGSLAADKAKTSWVRYVAAAIFVALGVATVATNLWP